MQGMVFRGNRQIELRRFEDPTPGPNDAILEIKASGMCGTDLHYYRAPPLFADPDQLRIGGHEPAGIVVALGAAVPARTAKVGDRVMVHHYHGCTTCEHCRTGWPQLCTTVEMELYGGGRFHGAHARYMKVPASTLVALDDAMDFTAGAAIACGTGTAWGALLRLNLTGRDTLAVFGQGPVGLSATMIAAAQGARVIALDINAARLERAKHFGADETIDVTQGGVPARIRELTGGKGVSAAMETSGASAAANDALHSLAVWGRACMVGMGSDVNFNVQAFTGRQMTVLTSWSMSSDAQKECADFAIQRGLDFTRLFTHRWELGQAEQAYQTFDKQADGKAVFVAF